MLVGSQSEPLEAIAGLLQQQGYIVRTVDSPNDALAAMAVIRPQVILLFTGRESFSQEARRACLHAKQIAGAAVVVIIPGRDVESRAKILRSGADVCLAWPVSLHVLLARIEALLRRGRQRAEAKTPPFVRHDLYVDFDAREVWVKGERKDLTPREFDLLAALIDCSQHRARDDRQLLRTVWPGDEGNRELLRQYIWRLRHKIEPDPTTPEYILYEPGFGYRLTD